MAMVRVNVKEHYGVGEIWAEAGNATEALQRARDWRDENPPWKVRAPEPVR